MDSKIIFDDKQNEQFLNLIIPAKIASDCDIGPQNWMCKQAFSELATIRSCIDFVPDC